MSNDRFPRSLREADGHSHGNNHIHDSDPPSVIRSLAPLLIGLLMLAIIVLCYVVAPNTKAYDCRSDTECVVLKR